MQRYLSWLRFICITFTLFAVHAAHAADFERRDVTFTSEGARCAAWFYLPGDLKSGEKRPAVVMAHGWTAVKEMYLDSFAERFAKAGFVVLVFDYRGLGASEGQPRGEIRWRNQLEDYRNAISWVATQPQVDAKRIGIWGTSYSGGHVLAVAAFDARVKVVVSQVPVAQVWQSYYAALPADQRQATLDWLAQARQDRYLTGNTNSIPVVAPEGKPSSLPQQESYDWFTTTAKLRAPNWINEVSAASIDDALDYDPTAYIHLIAPKPLLMLVASDDIVTPTELEVKAFERAQEPKKLIVIPGRHFDAYNGPKHEAFAQPAVEWFRKHLMP
jgi:hypothetical protein